MTALPAPSLTVNVEEEIVVGSAARTNVADTGAEVEVPVAPAAGDVEVTVNGSVCETTPSTK